MTSGEMASARLGATLGFCAHGEVEPVELFTGEIVATVCVACLIRLPPSWGCEDCSYVEDTMFSSLAPTRTLADRCARHQKDWRL